MAENIKSRRKNPRRKAADDSWGYIPPQTTVKIFEKPAIEKIFITSADTFRISKTIFLAAAIFWAVSKTRSPALLTTAVFGACGSKRCPSARPNKTKSFPVGAFGYAHILRLPQYYYDFLRMYRNVTIVYYTA
jgi:hypothetical protein